MTTSVIHHRINEQLEQYWNSLCAGRPMPLESEINIDDLANIWDHCFLVNIAGERLAYSYLGSELMQAYGDDFTGKEITDTLVYPHPVSLMQTFRTAIRTARPQQDESTFTNARGMLIKYRSCVLPLGMAGETDVRFLLGGMKWKAY
jgi:hypothetical protein